MLPPNDPDMTFVYTFYHLMVLIKNYTYVAVINTIFLSIKLFDYLNKSKYMNMLSKTLYSSREDTFFFLVIFVILIFGFVFLSYISFGWIIEDYSSIGSAVRSCFSITIGDFDYDDLSNANGGMAAIFFFPFNILFVFILTNIFLAIINEAYESNRLSSEDVDDVNII